MSQPRYSTPFVNSIFHASRIFPPFNKETMNNLADLGEKMGADPESRTHEPTTVCMALKELGDGRFTIFVPSLPTPFAGAVYILSGNGCIP